MDTKKLQAIQQDYDNEYWEVNYSEFEKIRHITLHIWKLMGKLSAYCERKEHGVDQTQDVLKDEIIPDLLVYAAQLGNLMNVDVGDTFLKRIERNKSHFKKIE